MSSHHRPVSPCRLAKALAGALTTLSLSAAAWGQPIRWRSVEAAPRPPVTSDDLSVYVIEGIER